MAENFTCYLRMMIVHLGVMGWQQLFSPLGLSPPTEKVRALSRVLPRTHPSCSSPNPTIAGENDFSNEPTPSKWSPVVHYLTLTSNPPPFGVRALAVPRQCMRLFCPERLLFDQLEWRKERDAMEATRNLAPNTQLHLRGKAASTQAQGAAAAQQSPTPCC